MPGYDRVLVEIAGGIGTVTLNRPEKLNAFDGAQCRELHEALRMLAGSEAVRVIVITGAGRAFCAGADLSVLGADGASLVAAGKDVALTIRSAPQPVLAAVNGPATGGGANLALACDYRIASDQASIGQVFHKLGLVPDWGGSFFLPRLVGTAKALELVWSARMVPAAEALALGLFDRVVPHERLQAEARALAGLWASHPALAVRRAKEALYLSEQRSLSAMLDLELAQQMELFATVEQQRNLLGHAPTDYDLLALMRVMTEEMRHGWQMSYLLCAHFGDEGKREAAKLLERRADEGERLLGSFNEIVATWLDFFTYTQFIDRDGKFQLKMLSVSGFDPLSRSMGPMLKEESFHLGTGNNGLLRIVKAGKMPAETIQRFFYKWVPTAFDLFGNDNSSSAHWAYVWGLKGRYDERENAQEPDKAKLNEYARELYRQEIVKLVERLNMFIPERERWLKVPELKFNRKIGVYAHQMYTVDGEPIDSKERYAAYLKTVLPQARDYEVVKDIEREPDWIEAKKADSLLKQ